MIWKKNLKKQKLPKRIQRLVDKAQKIREKAKKNALIK